MFTKNQREQLSSLVQTWLRHWRGARQGDPLSPYLFIIVMKVFSRKLYHVENMKQIEGIKIAPGDPSIPHLLFADDCLLFLKVDFHNVNNVLKIIEDFRRASGQMVNFNKSNVYFSAQVPRRFCRILTRRLKVPKMQSNTRYLGIPLIIWRKRRSVSLICWIE